MSSLPAFKSAVASSVPYDNTASGYGTGDVQSAIDAVAAAIASGILNYDIVSSSVFTTTSSTDVDIPSYTVTPQSGTYAVFHSANITQSTNNSIADCTIYKGGVAVSDSNRKTQGSSSNWRGIQSSTSITNFNGSQACNIRVSISSGTLTINGRSLLLIRLGP